MRLYYSLRMFTKTCGAGNCAFVIIWNRTHGGGLAVAVDTMEISWKDTLLYIFQVVEGSGILGL